MNTDQRNRFSKNICKSYKQKPDLYKILAHSEFKDAVFLRDTVKALIRSVMGNNHDTGALDALLEQIHTLPAHQQSDVAQAAFKMIGSKYSAYTSVVEHSFDQVCVYGNFDHLVHVFNIWANSYSDQHLIPSFIARAPDSWKTSIERSVLQDLANNRYPQSLFKFIPEIKSVPLPEVVEIYLKGFSRSPDHAMQEVERVLDDRASNMLLEFATVLLERFSRHPNFTRWHELVQKRHERMGIKVQHIVLSRHVNAVEHISERPTRKI